MKKKYQFFLLMLFIIHFPTDFIIGQKAPIIIENWDGDGTYKQFFCSDKPGVNRHEDRIIRGNSAIEGNASLRIEWKKLKPSQYFCWGVDLRQGGKKGKDIHEAKYLTFRVKLKNGKEYFEIKIKDTEYINPGVNANMYIGGNTSIQTVKIPIANFGGEVNLFSIENISLDFDRATAGKEGAIIIDDFKFEYQ